MKQAAPPTEQLWVGEIPQLAGYFVFDPAHQSKVTPSHVVLWSSQRRSNLRLVRATIRPLVKTLRDHAKGGRYTAAYRAWKRIAAAQASSFTDGSVVRAGGTLALHPPIESDPWLYSLFDGGSSEPEFLHDDSEDFFSDVATFHVHSGALSEEEGWFYDDEDDEQS